MPPRSPRELLPVLLLAGCATVAGPVTATDQRGTAVAEPKVTHTHHAIDYIELGVTDLAVAKRFFAEAFGWRFNDYGPDYAGIQGDARELGGLLQVPEVRPGGPLVVLYSADLDASLAQVRAAGGRIVKEPIAFPGGRRFHFADPSGNELAVWSER